MAILADKDQLAMIDGIMMKGKRIIIPSQLQKQLHNNHMDAEKRRLLVCKSVCWLNINTDVQNTV